MLRREDGQRIEEGLEKFMTDKGFATLQD